VLFFIVPMLSSVQLCTPLFIFFFHRRRREFFRSADHVAPPSARNECRPAGAVVDVVVAVVVGLSVLLTPLPLFRQSSVDHAFGHCALRCAWRELCRRGRF